MNLGGILSEFTTRSKSELARLISIQVDLEFVVSSTQILIEHLKHPDHDKIIVKSLYTTAVIVYCRCFSTGKRSPLTAETFSDLPPDALKAHNYFKSMRDKHIAHSVNRFEDVKVGVALNPAELGPPGIIGLGYYKVSRYADGADTIQILWQLALHALSAIEVQGRILYNQVLEETRELDLSELYRNGSSSYTAPGMDDASKPRI